MSRQIDLISSSEGIHYLSFGMNSNETSSFAIMIWITKYGIRMVDWMQSMGMGFITFMGGDLYVHNSDNVNRCNLYGEKRDCIVGVVSNEQPGKIKLYDSVGVHSDGTWEIYEITIPASLNYPFGMYSKIPSQRFKKRDGVWKAEFLRNMRVASATEVNPIYALSGEPLRGYEIYMKLRNTSDGQIRLFKIDVSQTLSRI